MSAEYNIAELIYLIRGQKVIFDFDLAKLYDVETGQLNRAVKRNPERFPNDFLFQITGEEFEDLKCQFGISKSWGGRRRSFPYAFTEQGVAMLSSVLRSKRAALVNVEIMRAFVKMRELISAHKELAQKISALERKIGKHDKEIVILFEAIKELMRDQPAKRRRGIGF